MKQYWRIFEIKPSGWLLLAVLYFFMDLHDFLMVLLCVWIHEMGHLTALERFGVRVRRIMMDCTGMTIQYNTAQLNGLKECLAALAGPMFGLSAAVCASLIGNTLKSERLLLFAGANAILSLFNLLPAKPLDGWRCLHVLFPIGSQIISVCTALCVLVFGIYLMYAGYGIALAVMGILLLLQENPGTNIKHRKIEIK